MPEQEFDLLQIPAVLAAEFGAGTAEALADKTVSAVSSRTYKSTEFLLGSRQNSDNRAR
jgi:hypothetical protein